MIYADHAATTKMSAEAMAAMVKGWEVYGNPSSLHTIGQEAAVVLQKAREQIAVCLDADPKEIYFTSGGSEADNWAIKGTAELMAKKGKKHIISTTVEHHAVLHTLKKLEKQGFEITLLPVSSDGFVSPGDVASAIKDDTALVTVMYANNEIGTIQPITEIGEICREKGVIFHTDAVQAVGHLPIDVKAQNIDMLSMSGHKFHGPKGIGALYIRKGINLPNLIEGGAQERNRRAGTENIPGIVGMAAALTEAVNNMEENTKKVAALRDRLIEKIKLADSSTESEYIKLIKKLAIDEHIDFEAFVLKALRASQCCSISICRAFARHQAPRAHRARLTQATYFSQ